MTSGWNPFCPLGEVIPTSKSENSSRWLSATALRASRVLTRLILSTHLLWWWCPHFHLQMRTLMRSEAWIVYVAVPCTLQSAGQILLGWQS